MARDVPARLRRVRRHDESQRRATARPPYRRVGTCKAAKAERAAAKAAAEAAAKAQRRSRLEAIARGVLDGANAGSNGSNGSNGSVSTRLDTPVAAPAAAALPN